jgi:hypothetical protein
MIFINKTYVDFNKVPAYMTIHRTVGMAKIPRVTNKKVDILTYF